MSYFSNTELVGPPTPGSPQCLATVHASWGTASPSALITGDTFSARYTRKMLAGNYTFTIKADDGYRVKVNGTTVSDQWGNVSTLVSTPIALTLTGPVSEVVLEYQELGGFAFFDVHATGGVPFLTTNTQIAATGGIGALGSWSIDTFAAPGNPATALPLTNSMNLGVIRPQAIATEGNEVYVSDFYGTLDVLDRDGSFIARHTIPGGVVGLEPFPLSFLGFATQCDVGSIDTITGVATTRSTSCGGGVVPGTYLFASLVFEGGIIDLAVDGSDVYVMDNKYVWKTDTLFTSFKTVIGTQNAMPSPDGADGLSYTLSTPLSIAARNGNLVIGQVGTVLKFQSTGTDTFVGSVLIGASPVPGDPATTLSASDTTVHHVAAVGFLDNDTVLFAERYRDILRAINLTTLMVSSIAGKEWIDQPPYEDSMNFPTLAANSRLFEPVDIVVGNSAVYVAQDGYSIIRRLR